MFHAESHAALQSAVLASVPMMFVNDTLSGPPTRVHQILPDAALKETLTALTAHCSIVTTWTHKHASSTYIALYIIH